MPRKKPSNSFGKRSTRFKSLESDKEHWTACDEGVYVGYRRGKTKSVWYVRRYVGAGKYEQAVIGLADDHQDPDGEDVLTFFQAQTRAKERAAASAAETKPLPKRHGYTVRDAVAGYMTHYRAVSGKQTDEVQRLFDRDVVTTLGGIALKDLVRSDLVQWRNNLIRQRPRNRAGRPVEYDLPATELKRRRKATAQRKWTILRAALNHAFASGEVSSDAVWRSIKPIQGIDAPPPTRILTAKECRLVTSKLPNDFRPIAEATYLTGAAFKELRETVVEDYMPESGHLRIFNTKRRARLVPLTEEGLRLFDAQTAGKAGSKHIFTDANGEPWNKSTQSRRMRKASAAAKILPTVTLTQLRDAYGSLLLNNGVSLEVVSKAMGHASTDTTKKHYAHLLQGTVDKAIREGLPDLGISSSGTVRRLR